MSEYGHGPVAEEANDFLKTALKYVISDKFKQQVEDTSGTILETFKELVEQLFCYVTLSTNWGIRNLVTTP